MLPPLAFLALAISVIEHARGWSLAPREAKLRLRALWRGWPTGAYGRFAFHETDALTRGRLRRSGYAQMAFLTCVALGLVATAAVTAPLASGLALAPVAMMAVVALAATCGVGLIALAMWRAPR